MLAALLIEVDIDGNIWVSREVCESGLTLTEAAKRVSLLADCKRVEFAVCSPDLWNRRQDSGRSGFEIMQSINGMPPMRAADDRRIAGWRILREYLAAKGGHPFIKISSRCVNLISSLPALLYDSKKTEDASSSPHSITHSPEALRYAVMSRAFFSPPEADSEPALLKNFRMPKKHSIFE